MKTFTNQWIVVMAASSVFTLLGSSPAMAQGDPDGGCIASGETKMGTISPGGDADSFTFCGQVGQGVVIAMANSSAAAALHPRLRLVDPDGIELVDWPGGSNRTEIDNCQLQKAGIYTIVASGSTGVATGEYAVSLVLAPGATTSPEDRDGNDVTSGETRSGTLSHGADLDAYVFYGEPNHRVVTQMADISATGALFPRLRLYDPDGIQVVDWPSGGERTEISYQVKKTGMYTIVASNGYGVATGEYGFSVDLAPPIDPYGLYPYGPQPVDGQVIDYCDPNYVVPDVVVKNEVLSDGNEVERLTGGDYLSWWSVIGATGYDVYFSGGACLPLEKIGENVTDPWLPMPEVEDEQVCSWRVVAHTPDGDIQGPTWWFMARCVPPPPDGCTLTVDVVGRGSIEGADVGINEYPCGAEVLIKAKPDPGYEFVRWEGSAADGMEDPTAPEITLIVDDDEALIAVFEDLVHAVTMNVDPGWTLEGQWEYGTPTGQRCSGWGNVDPTSGCTGPNVLGVNLDGCYDLAIGDPYYATTDAIDLSGYEDIRLRFCRWLNCDIPEYVRCTVEASTDGQHWTLLWTQAEREAITDTEWTLCEYPLAQADSQPTVYLRWGYHILRERAYDYTGWNLDDVQLIGRRP